jgi:membrane dipeptidase
MSPAATREAIKAAAAELRAAREKFAVPRATFEDVMQHMHHALDLVGPEHVGVGLDWDGGGGVTGLDDCAADWKVTEALVKSGVTESALRAIWGGNALRVLAAAEAAAKPAPSPASANSGGE